VSQGNLYDVLRLFCAVAGNTNAGLLARAEELVRYLQHHPEVLRYLASTTIATTFGVPVWMVDVAGHVLLSRGTAADWVGEYVMMLLPEGLRAYLPALLQSGLARRLGRSVLNRGLAIVHGLSSLAGTVGTSLVSGASRLLHGLGLSEGSLVPGPQPNAPSSAFWFLPSWLSGVVPQERLHIIPNQRHGPMTEENAAYGAAATNSMMIPVERTGVRSLAIRTPTGHLEAMSMNHGLFLGRGFRPREGVIEHELAQHYHIA